MPLKALVPAWLRRWLLAAEDVGYRATVAVFAPANWLLARLLKRRVRPGTVLHVSAMVHVPYYTVQLLRRAGVEADYLAVGDSPWWSRADYHFRPRRVPVVSVLHEMWWVWRVVSRYEILHAHFMVLPTRAGWEWPLLSWMGRKIVVHYRGCEIRDRALVQARNPRINICQECDYRPPPCEAPVNVRRRRLAGRYGHASLVTTPDLLEFAPGATYVPFLVMDGGRPVAPAEQRRAKGRFTIVHATNHPGIEGTGEIRRAVEALAARGWPVDLVELRGVTHERVREALAGADLSVGKMKMGHYANAQIESLAAGVPAVTWVRPEFMTDELRDSGFVFARLDTLEATLEHYLSHPAELEARRACARASILALHDNDRIVSRYVALYRRLGTVRVV